MEWIKNHKITTAFILVVLYFLFKDQFVSQSSYNHGYNIQTVEPKSIPGPLSPSFSNQISENRVTIKESNLSLLVEDVNKSGEQIISYAKTNAGYMVNTSYTKPGESPFGTITIRIPTARLDQTLTFIRSLGIKVISENIVGTDVTQEYTDIQAREQTLQKTKNKFEDILEKAINVQDIVSVQKELINIQDQLDSLKGQKQAINENTQLTKITVYLSTDELALPYAPDTAFRPTVIFKQAVRSLVNTIRGIGELLIWIFVYVPLWGGAIIIYLLYKRWKKKRTIA